MKQFFRLATLVATTGMIMGAGLVASGAASASAGGSHVNPGGAILRAPSTNSGLATISLN